ncbi:alpha/beta fold hydrolase [Marinobacter goseongensis]|uniref:alpha/beta fold hydrolase n=1 Tax=Marinobacter goseongensis TaxID=453838 RepID=UPI0020061871|nr:alpha/beta hydrolase [Marinobacter goseongensis]MCK7551884.1 alpha/beta hydrolase [Marinobacter goseongensis]
MRPQQWQSRGRTLNINGFRIFVVDEGQPNQDTILLIHGFPTASWDWHRIWPALRQSYRVVAMDMLGFGFSDKPGRHRYSIHGQADVVEGVVRQLGLGRFHVLAHDYGDTVAQELLARQNSGEGAGQWQSVCFLNGGLFPETHRALLTQKLLLSPLGPLFNKLSNKRRFNSAMARVFGPDTKPDARELEDFWALVNHNNGKHIFHNLITYMNDRKQHRERWVSAIRDARVPVALINGSLDPVSGAHMVARFRELDLPLAWFGELPRIGHYPQIEAPGEVSGSYLKFLEQL